MKMWALLLLSACGGVTTRALPVDDEGKEIEDGGPFIAVNGDLGLRLELVGLDAGEIEEDAAPDAGLEKDAGDGLNACGGTGVLYREPGTGCEGPSGPCSWGSWECIGADTVDCLACEPCEECGS